MKKKIEKIEDYCVRFTDEELAELGIKEGDKFSVSLGEDGESLVFAPYKPVEIELEEFSKEALIELVAASCDMDIPVSEVIENILRELIQERKKQKEAEDPIVYILRRALSGSCYIEVSCPLSDALKYEPMEISRKDCFFISPTSEITDYSHFFDFEVGRWRKIKTD